MTHIRTNMTQAEKWMQETENEIEEVRKKLTTNDRRRRALAASENPRSRQINPSFVRDSRELADERTMLTAEIVRLQRLLKQQEADQMSRISRSPEEIRAGMAPSLPTETRLSTIDARVNPV